MNYFLTDHLGSVRVIVDGSGVVKERNDYYPFGARHVRGDYPKNDNRLLYNGKEEQVTGDLDYLDYGARMYDSGLGRWFGMDPLAEEYLQQSPYHFSGNNPNLYMDMNGMFYDWFTNADGSLCYNPLLKKGDESRLGETWSWLGSNGMFGMDDEFIIKKFSSLVTVRGVIIKRVYNQRTGDGFDIPLSTAFFNMDNARDFMDGMGYEYAMTQYVEDDKSYTMYADKGRGRMADFVYGNQDILVEKATYISKDKSVLFYQGLANLKDPKVKWNFMTLYHEKSIRYSNPILISSSWKKFLDLTGFGLKFGSEYDYRNKTIRYKK